MIKNFEEFINELWSKSVTRNMSNSLRKEDEAFFKSEDIHQIPGFDEYYLRDDMDENTTYIYHYPNTEWIAKFFDIMLDDDTIRYDSVDLKHGLDMTERKKILGSEFRHAIYKLIINS